MTNAPAPMTVTDLTRYIKRLLETDFSEVEVEGEISNWKLAASGHAYFNLKDTGAMLTSVIFQGNRARLPFAPREGDKVVARGKISVYEARGQYQLIVTSMRETGQGDLFRRFLELKERLEKEGLFDPTRKRQLPPLPKRIGIVTSASGAALRDIIHVIRRRFPGVELLISPTLVQGVEAPGEIVKALQRLIKFDQQERQAGRNGVDVIIAGRGGGSIEDLWAFNEEIVARAIAASPVPIISAVGHETDFTIADFVADLRAPTPSAAAEIVVAEIWGLRERVARLTVALGRLLSQLVHTRRLQLKRLSESWGLRQPLDLVRQAIQRVDDLSGRMLDVLENQVRDGQHRLERAQDKLDALNPTAVLSRGYSIVSLTKDGRVVTREKQAREGAHLRIQLSEGELRAAVLKKGEDMLEGLWTE